MWKSLRTTNTLENLNREFRRRTKTQASFGTEEAALTVLYGLVAFGRFSSARSTATSSCHRSWPTNGRKSRKDVEWSTVQQAGYARKPISTRLGTDPLRQPGPSRFAGRSTTNFLLPVAPWRERHREVLVVLGWRNRGDKGDGASARRCGRTAYRRHRLCPALCPTSIKRQPISPNGNQDRAPNAEQNVRVSAQKRTADATENHGVGGSIPSLGTIL